MVKRFTKNYPGVALHSSVLPALGFLQLVKSRCATKSWAWVPWRRILNIRRYGIGCAIPKNIQKTWLCRSRCRSSWIVRWWVGLDLLGVPRKVYQLLCVRTHTYTFCNFGHLQSWMGYVANFVEHYSRRLGPGFRPVKSQEAEEADKAMCNEVFRLVFHENGDIDSALSYSGQRRHFASKVDATAQASEAASAPSSLQDAEEDVACGWSQMGRSTRMAFVGISKMGNAVGVTSAGSLIGWKVLTIDASSHSMRCGSCRHELPAAMSAGTGAMPFRVPSASLLTVQRRNTGLVAEGPCPGDRWCICPLISHACNALAYHLYCKPATVKACCLKYIAQRLCHAELFARDCNCRRVVTQLVHPPHVTRWLLQISHPTNQQH